MKKKTKITKSIRVSLRTYELLRRIAFKAHKPMTAIIDEWANANKVWPANIFWPLYVAALQQIIYKCAFHWRATPRGGWASYMRKRWRSLGLDAKTGRGGAREA
jgi:hypothetical protein